jgi:hypothetical protein
LWQATKFVFRHFGKTYGLYLAVVVFSLALFLLYFVLDGLVMMRTPLTITLILLVQQLFIWLRIGTKVWLMGSELTLHTLVQPLEEQPTIARDEEPGPLPSIMDPSPTPLNAPESETLPQPG